MKRDKPSRPTSLVPAGKSETPVSRIAPRKLRQVGWLSMLPSDVQERFLKLGRDVSVPRGKLLYSAGDEPDAIFGIEDGLLDLAIPILDTEECIIHRGTPGFWIGDGALVQGTPRTLTVEAATDCRLLSISFVALRKHLSEIPGDWEYLHRLSTFNGILAIRILAEVLSLSPGARIARLLLRLAKPDGTVASNQEDLGRLAGMSRATFRRAISRLTASGAIQMKYSTVKIMDRSAVERQARL
jgi:CRP/FNR family cyclic AMP-dependent transcriptional regulator